MIAIIFIVVMAVVIGAATLFGGVDGAAAVSASSVPWWALAAVLVAFAGFFAGLLGIGGGSVMVPVLVMLFAAQGFPDDYDILPKLRGKPITKTQQIALAGNSVPPTLAEHVVRAAMFQRA